MSIYLNNAATSFPKPACVAEAMAAAVTAPPGAMHRGGIEDFDVFDAVRLALCPLLGVSDRSRIALGANATWGLNLAIFGFPFERGDTVVTTRAEHNSVLRPLFELQRRGLIRVIYLDTDATGRMPTEVWREAMQAYRPRLAVFTHASNVTGAVNDAEALTAAAKSAGAAVLLDASQTLGWKKLAAEDWGVDMLCFTGHKYLLGPQGTGGLWLREGLSLAPHLVGGTGIKSDMDSMPDELPLHLEAGTGNEPSFCGLLAALRWAGEHPRDLSLCEAGLERLREGLSRAGARVIVPQGDCTPVVSFTLPGISAAEAGFILTESCGITCRTGLHCAPKIFPCLGERETVRFSLSRFTENDELDAAVRAVEDIMS
ncbi:MAG: aminotransferase class V-fold PLP-dependent enzyme [Oscillospiraceae bacterium]